VDTRSRHQQVEACRARSVGLTMARQEKRTLTGAAALVFLHHSTEINALDKLRKTQPTYNTRRKNGNGKQN
jgi:hypothetical protein